MLLSVQIMRTNFCVYGVITVVLSERFLLCVCV